MICVFELEALSKNHFKCRHDDNLKNTACVWLKVDIKKEIKKESQKLKSIHKTTSILLETVKTSPLTKFFIIFVILSHTLFVHRAEANT